MYVNRLDTGNVDPVLEHSYFTRLRVPDKRKAESGWEERNGMGCEMNRKEKKKKRIWDPGYK